MPLKNPEPEDLEEDEALPLPDPEVPNPVQPARKTRDSMQIPIIFFFMYDLLIYDGAIVAGM
jgi:hypothetical protein